MRKVRSDKGKKRGPYKPRGSSPEVKITNRQRAINILKTGRLELERRFKYNQKGFADYDTPDFINNKNRVIKNQMSMIDEGIKVLENSKFRPRDAAVDLFEEIWTIKSKKGLGYEDLNYRVNDKDTNFKRLILDELEKQGVNIYNPTELYRLFKGRSFSDIIDAYLFANTTDEANADYTAIQSDVVGYIQDILTGLEDEEIEASQRIASNAVAEFDRY